jgi:WD40 repeat protein
VNDFRLLKWCIALAACAVNQPSWAQSKDSPSKVRVHLLGSFEGHDEVRHLAFSPDGEILAADTPDVTVWLWDVSKRKHRATIDFGGRFQAIDSLAFTPDGKGLAATAGAEALKIWDVKSGKRVLDLEDRSGGLGRVAFSPDGEMMATAGMRMGPMKNFTGVVRWRQTKDHAQERRLEVKDGPVQSIDFSPDGQTLALVTDDGWMGLKMMAAKERYLRHLAAALATRGRLSASEIQLPVPEFRCVLKLVDLGTGRVMKSVRAHKDTADVVKFSPDGRILATGGGDTLVKLWDPSTCKVRCELKGHESTITCLAFSPDSRFLASADEKGVKLWDVASGQELREASKQLKGNTAVAFSRQGILATGWQIGIGIGSIEFEKRQREKCIIRLWKLETD